MEKISYRLESLDLRWVCVRYISFDVTVKTNMRNVHQERGLLLSPDIDVMDEEARFSSVIRQREKVDVGEDGEDRQMDDRNEETFGSFTGPGGSSASPSGSSVSAPLTGESESKPSRPSSADSTQVRFLLFCFRKRS